MSTLNDLMDALDARDVERLRLLLPAEQEAMNRTLLAAALRGEAEAAELLLISGAEPSVTDSRGDPCLICIGIDYPMMRLLLEFGANVNAISTDGITALHLFIIHQNPDAVGYLLEHGAITKPPDGVCSLELAKRYESAEIIAQIERARICEDLHQCKKSKNLDDSYGVGL